MPIINSNATTRVSGLSAYIPALSFINICNIIFLAYAGLIFYLFVGVNDMISNINENVRYINNLIIFYLTY